MTLTKICAVLTQVSVTLPEIYAMLPKVWATLTMSSVGSAITLNGN